MPKAKKAVPAVRTISLHRGFEKDLKGETVFFIAEGGKSQKLSGLKLEAFMQDIAAGSSVRMTSLSAALPILFDMQDRGILLFTAHWHATGLAKGLSPEDIALGFDALDASVLRPVKLRRELSQLRSLITTRRAVMKYRKSVYLQVLSVVRSFGLADGVKKPAWLQEQLDSVDEIKKETEGLIEKEITLLARTIPECMVLNRILDVKGSWMTSAGVVGVLGYIARFPTVSALWHYTGQHVTNGKAPKRRKGEVQTWNSDVRTTMWTWVDSMLKTKNPTWRPVYDSYLAEEKLKNEVRPDKDKLSDGHMGARARRRVTKDVLKTFWVEMHKDAVMIPVITPKVKVVAKVVEITTKPVKKLRKAA